MKVNGKKLIIGIIAALLLMIFPDSVFAADVILGDPNAKYIYVIDIRVGDKSGAGTDGDVTAYFYFTDTTKTINLEIPKYDDLERGSVTTYKVGINIHPLSLWSVQIKNQSTDAVYIEWIAFMVKNGNKTELKQEFFRFDQWFESKHSTRSHSAYLYVSKYTQRNVTSLGDFNSIFNRTIYLEEGETGGTVDIIWDGKITDQYGTYKYYEKVPGNPKLSISLSGIGLDGAKYNKFEEFFSSSEIIRDTYSGQEYVRGFRINKKALYEKMKKEGISKLVITPNLQFSGIYSANFYGSVTIVRKNFSIGSLAVFNDYDTFHAMQDNYFYNKSAKEIMLVLEILNNRNHDNYYANVIASNLTGDFRLYYNKEGDYVAPVRIDSIQNYAILTFPVPAESDNDGSGLKLAMTGVTSKTLDMNGAYIDGFKLVDGDLPYTGEPVERYLSTYKVDTRAPVFSLSDAITGVWRNTITFGVSSSENLYLDTKTRDAKKKNAGLFYYTLYDSKSFAEKGEKAPSVSIKSFDNDNGGPGSHYAPYSESTKITLKLMNKEEGRYTLALSGYDFAGNRAFQTYSDILLDNKAPNVSLSVKESPRSNYDHTRTAEYTFHITDLSETGVVNYCFVKDGDSIPPLENPVKTSGKIESTIGKWAYMQQSDAPTTTVVLKLKGGESFKGRLYYFATDASQNSTAADNKSKNSREYGIDTDTGYNYLDIDIDNRDTECTLVVDSYSYPQSDYNISFDYGSNSTVKYRWVGLTPYREYTGEQNVGSGIQLNGSNQQITLHGECTLEYVVTNKSGNMAVYTKKFVFDNKEPVAAITNMNSGAISNAHTFILSASDISGIKSASYAIVNAADTSVIYDSGSIEPSNGIVNTSVNIENMDSGAYKLIFTVEDNNGTIKVKESNTIHIRSSAPEVEIHVDFENTIMDSYITSVRDYHVSLKVSEPMNGADLFAKKQYVQYRVSGDGVNYGDWITGGMLDVDDKGLSAEFEISNPMVLNEGENRVYIQVANATFTDNPDRILPDLITTLAPIKIYYDAHGPEYSISLDDSVTSAPSITGTIYLKDREIGNEGMTLLSGNNNISVSEPVEEEGTGYYQYTITITDNVETSIIARDKAGNETEIPVRVNCFDRQGPLVELSLFNYENKGERMDASGEIVVKGAILEKTRFALIKKSEYTGELREDDFIYDTSHFSAVTSPGWIEPLTNGESNAMYSFSIKGLTGTYMIGVYAVDYLGNETVEIVCDEVTVEDAEARLVDTRIVSSDVMYDATVVLNFNVPVYVLPKELYAPMAKEGMELDETNMELAMNYASFYSSTHPYLVSSNGTHQIYAVDECGRTYTFEITVDNVVFGEGIPVTWQLTRDYGGQETLNKEEVHSADDAFLHVSIDTNVYRNAVLLPLTYVHEESGSIGGIGNDGWYIDEHPDFIFVGGIPANQVTPPVTASANNLPGTRTEYGLFADVGAYPLTVAEAVYGQQERQGYKTLIYKAMNTGRTIPNVSFLVREYEDPQPGNNDVRWKDTYERLAIDCIDTTPPRLDLDLSTYTYTTENVLISLSASDPESGIEFFGYHVGEYFYWENLYELKQNLTQVVKEPEPVYDEESGEEIEPGQEEESEKSGNVISTTIEVEESTHVIVYVENGAGMYFIMEFPVNNIFKDPITYGEDYVVSYYYQDYTGEWKEMTDDVYYRNAKAVIQYAAPGQSQNDRGLYIANNAGSNERILTVNNNTFEFELADRYGNKEKHTVSANRFELEGPEISCSVSNTSKTNKPVDIEITIKDEISGVVPDLVRLEDKQGIIPLTYESEPDGSFLFHAEIAQSGIYTITAMDGIGNISVKSFEITNIDTTPPEITGLSYSTKAWTNQSVSVQIKGFTKPGVTITRTEPVGTLTTRDYQVSAFTNMINFSKNGTITVFFIDEYGNEGSDIISVNNIYTAPPSLLAVPKVAQDKLSVNVTFEQEKTEDGDPIDPVRTLEDLFVSYGGIVYPANEASFNFTDNGSYTFKVFDNAGMIQYISLDIADIDKTAPQITQVTWSYNYYKNENNEWVLKTETGSVIPGGEAGYTVADDLYPATNQDVKVKVTTDKETSYIGEAGDEIPDLEHELNYKNNGLFIFNLKSANGLNTAYGVDIEVIDKTPPVIELENPVDLMFIENGSTYRKELLHDYKAYDTFNGVTRDLTANVMVDWGGFDPDNLSNNIFDRTKPYYITYKVYDRVGNYTEIRRKITLVGLADTIALVNGIMPDATSSVVLKGDSFDISLYNFSGTAYVKYEPGQYTMGQMKSKGTVIAGKDGKYSLDKLSNGWYTVYIQTDRRDYFVVYVYVSGSGK